MAGEQKKSNKIGRSARSREGARRVRHYEVFYPLHKLKAILLHNSVKDAKTWAAAHSHTTTLLRLVRTTTARRILEKVAAAGGI
jgi:hypothetical protein